MESLWNTIMFSHLARWSTIICGLCLVSLLAGRIEAQPRSVKSGSKSTTADGKGTAGKSRAAGDRKRRTTLIQLEIITGDEGVGIRAQRWTQILEKFDLTLTIRHETPKDKLGVTEKTTGDSLRQVLIVGQLDRSGRLQFGDRTFTENDADKLSAWLDELREFGAQGTPDGRPAWGLTRPQLEGVHAALSKPLATNAQHGELMDVLKLLALPSDLPIRLTEEAAALLKGQDETKVGQALNGVSQGTALAVMLSEHGLGFFPRRLPNGSIQLTIDTLEKLREPWPVGWPLEQGVPMVAPRLFTFTPIDLEEIELDAVLDAAVDFIEMPILVDHRALDAKQIDLSQVKVSHPPKRTTWGIALRNLLSQAKTKYEVLADEAGRPFLWITPQTAPRRPQN
jgi:hypothetical protein